MSNLSLTLHVWRQKGRDDEGRFVRYAADDVDEHMSFLEMLDVVNEDLIEGGEEPISFDHDCREGICGACRACRSRKPAVRCRWRGGY